MSHTLIVPDEIYTRAEEIAHDTARPVDEVLLEQLRLLADPLTALPPDEQAELTALRHLSDDALWTIAAEQMPETVQEQMQTLMDRNSQGTITEDEYAELEQLVNRGNRLMLRKAEASGLLIERGHPFTQADFKRKHG